MSEIINIIEPERLLLCWQAPEGSDRTKFVVAEIYKGNESVNFRYFVNTEDFRNAQELGFVGYPAFRHLDKTFSDGVLDTFLRRIPPKSRGDYFRYLELFRLPLRKNLSDFALLGYTGAKLPTDGFSIALPFSENNEDCEFLMELAGFRYAKNISLEDLQIGDRVSLKQDPANKHDSNAIRVEYKGVVIGYISRPMLKTFHHWLNSDARLFVTIERINGNSDRPVVYLFVKVQPKGAARKPTESIRNTG